MRTQEKLETMKVSCCKTKSRQKPETFLKISGFQISFSGSLLKLSEILIERQRKVTLDRKPGR